MRPGNLHAGHGPHIAGLCLGSMSAPRHTGLSTHFLLGSCKRSLWSGGERLTAGTMCRMTDHANEMTLSCGTTADDRCSVLSPLALAAAGEAPPHSADADVWVSLQLSGIRMASCTYSQVARSYKRAVNLQ